MKHDIRIIILLDKSEKELLEKEANHNSLPLSSYCRMILIQSLKHDKNL